MLARCTGLAVLCMMAATLYAAPASAQSRFDIAREEVCGNDPVPACERAVRHLCGDRPTRACLARNKKRFDAATRSGARAR